MKKIYKTILFVITVCLLIFLYILFYDDFLKEGFMRRRYSKSECNLRTNCSSCLDGLASGGDHCAWGNNKCISTSDIRYNSSYSYDKKTCQY
jgi:hypothetical protein